MLAAIILSAALVQERTVTFTHPCAHSSVVLEAFGREIGETIMPGGSVNKDYFLVRFDGMPVEDAKEAIAKALNATWAKQGDTLYLNRTHAQELAEESAIDENLRRTMLQDIKRARTRVSNSGPFVLAELIEKMKVFASLKSFTSSDEVASPYERFKDRILAVLDVDDLMDLPLGSTPYSSNPQFDERPFPPALADAVKAYREEREVWTQVVEAALDDSTWHYDRDIQTGAMLQKVVIEFDRRKGSVFIWVGLGIDLNTYTARIDRWIPGYSSMSQWSRFYGNVDGRVKIAKVMTDAWNFITPQSGNSNGLRFRSARKRSELPALLARTVEDLAHNEPLTVLVSWPILEVAERKGANIVALFDDSVIGWPLSAELADDMPLVSVFRRAGRGFMATYDKGLSCWLARPVNPSAARFERADREEVGRLLDAVKRDSWMRLDDMAGFLRRTGMSALPEVWKTWVNIAGSDQDPSPYRYTGPTQDIAT